MIDKNKKAVRLLTQVEVPVASLQERFHEGMLPTYISEEALNKLLSKNGGPLNLKEICKY